MEFSKILIIAPYLSESPYSASSVYIYSLASALSHLKPTIILCPKKPQLTPERQYILQFPHIFRLVTPRLSATLLALYYTMFPKVLVISDINPFFTFPSSKNAVHIVHHVNDLPSFERFIARLHLPLSIIEPMVELFTRLVWKASLRFSPRYCITVSNSTAGNIASLDPSKVTFTIYNPIRREFSHDLSKTSTPPLYDILMIGHLYRRKNYPKAFDIFRSYNKFFGSRLKISIVGNHTFNLAPLTSDLDVTFFSNLSIEELTKLFRCSKVFVSTSNLEGFCLPFVEAQCLGLPCFVSNIDVFHEFAFNDNIHYISEDTNTAISNLHGLLVDPSECRTSHDFSSIFSNASIRNQSKEFLYRLSSLI
jgi:glycosyltransferase involved in cell wall biosynthesis